MRERYLEVFDRIWIDCLQRRQVQDRQADAPDGEPDPSVFSTRAEPRGHPGRNRHLAACARPSHHAASAAGVELPPPTGARTKRGELLRSCRRSHGRIAHDASVAPATWRVGLPFAPPALAGEYLGWPMLPDLLPRLVPGREDEPRRPASSTSTATDSTRECGATSIRRWATRKSRSSRPCCDGSTPADSMATAVRDDSPSVATRQQHHRPLLLPALRSSVALLGTGNQAAGREARPSTLAHVSWRHPLWYRASSGAAEGRSALLQVHRRLGRPPPDRPERQRASRSRGRRRPAPEVRSCVEPDRRCYPTRRQAPRRDYP